MRLYGVTLGQLDAGRVKRRRYVITAGNHLEAVDAILKHTLAPRSAVLTWEECSPAEVKRWRRETGIV